MSVGRIGSIAGAMILIGGALVAGASSASANQVWNQSVGRASADAPCPTSSPADLAAGWSEWGASWSQWANNGTGGFTCNRSITWAYSESAPAGPGCVAIGSLGGPTYYVNFAGSSYLPFPVNMFATTDCSGDPVAPAGSLAYATSSDAAVTLCMTGGAIPASEIYAGGDPNVWLCQA